MNTDFARAREWVVTGVKENPVAPVVDPEVMARLDDPDGDCTFEDLGFDSLAGMELCIYIECETQIALSTGDLQLHPSINCLAEYLRVRLAEDAG